MHVLTHTNRSVTQKLEGDIKIYRKGRMKGEHRQKVGRDVENREEYCEVKKEIKEGLGEEIEVGEIGDR